MRKTVFIDKTEFVKGSRGKPAPLKAIAGDVIVMKLYSMLLYKLPEPRPARARVILLEENRRNNAAIIKKRRGYHA